MKNEFDFNELKAGYAIKIPKYNDELLIGFQIMNDILFYSKEHNLIITKCEIMNDTLEDYIPIEVYGLSNNEHLFDSNTRPLLWKKKDMNKKEYNIGSLNITPNYKDGYKTKNEGSHLDDGFIYIRTKESEDEFEEDGYFISEEPIVEVGTRGVWLSGVIDKNSMDCFISYDEFGKYVFLNKEEIRR